MKRLKAERLEQGLTQFELAREADVLQQQVSCLERGFMVSEPAFKTLCDFFELEPEEALEDVGEEVA